MKIPKMVKTELDQQIWDLVLETDKKTLMIWACDCVERVLPYFEKKYPDDNRPRVAIEAGRQWERTGVFHMKDIRRVALASHAAAREIPAGEAAHSVARAAGQALATAHVATHSIAAAIYAATAVRDASGIVNDITAATQERLWQYQHLLDLRGGRNSKK